MGLWFGEVSEVFEWVLRVTIQGSVLVGIILLVRWLLRGRLSARWRYWLWMLLLVRLVMPWAPSSSFSVFNLMPVRGDEVAEDYAKPRTGEVSAELLPVGPEEETATVEHKGVIAVERAADNLAELAMPGAAAEIETEDVSGATKLWGAVKQWGWETLLRVIWLAGVMIFAVYAGVVNLRFWLRVRGEPALSGGKVYQVLEESKRVMEIDRQIWIIETRAVKGPALFGAVRTKLLVPRGMSESLNREELRHVFLHELTHLRRGDVAINWLVTLLQIVHWFNPVIWYAFWRMRADREIACDAVALSYAGEGQSQQYGQTIINLLQRFHQPQHLAGMVGILETKTQLKRRITMIAKFKRDSKKLTLAAVLTILLIACISLTDARIMSEAASFEPEAGQGDVMGTGEWSEPVKLGPEINTEYNENCPYLSRDGKTLYFSSDRPGGVGNADLYVSHKVNGVWQKPKNLGAVVNSPAKDTGPMLSYDGRYLFFWSERLAPPRTMLFVSEIVDGEYRTPQPLPYFINSSMHTDDPFLTADGETLYFQAFRREGSHQIRDLWRVSFEDGEFGAPVNLGPTINRFPRQQSPSLTADGRFMYYLCEREYKEGGSFVFSEIVNGQFQAPVPIEFASLAEIRRRKEPEHKQMRGISRFEKPGGLEPAVQDAELVMGRSRRRMREQVERNSKDIDYRQSSRFYPASGYDGDTRGFVDGAKVSWDGRKLYFSMKDENYDIWCASRSAVGAVKRRVPTRSGSGLVAHWKFDEGSRTRAHDSAGGHHGIVRGAAWTAGKIGTGLGFDGVDDVVNTTMNVDQSRSSRGATFCAWVYPTSISEGRHHVISSDNRGYDWSLLREGDIWCVFTGEGSRSAGFGVDLFKWQHVTAVFVPGAGVRFYKNSTEFTVPHIDYDDSDNNIAVGGSPGHWDEFFAGVIDEVMIFDRPLTSEEVEQICLSTEKIRRPSRRRRIVPATQTRSGWVDILGQIDVERDAKGGDWRREDGTLIGFAQSTLETSYKLPAEYDVMWEFESNSTAINLLLVSPLGKRFEWMMKGWSHRLCGIRDVDCKPVNANETTTAFPLQSGVRYVAEVKVRKDRFVALINGEEILNYKTDWSNVQVCEAWHPFELQGRRLGLWLNKHWTKTCRLQVRPHNGDGGVADNLIVPGTRVGNYAIGISKDDVLKSLGKPNVIFHRGEKYTLDNLPKEYFMVYDDISFGVVDDSVEGVSALGPLYKFANGLGIGDSEQKIKQAFGHNYHFKETDGKDYLTYEDEGIQFEIHKENRTVMEISVFRRTRQRDAGPRRVASDLPDGTGGYALEFDGVDDFIEVPDSEQLDIGDAFTVEMWAKVHDVRGEDAILSKEVPWRSGWTLLVAPGGVARYRGRVSVGSKPYAATFAVGDGTGFYNLTSSPCIDKGKWHRIAATWERGKAMLFVGGRFVASQVFPDAPPARVPLRIGKGSADLGRHFNGELAEVRIWNVARSEEDIRRDMRRRLTGQEPGLAAYWKLDEIEGDIIKDSSPNHNHGKLSRALD